MAFVRENLASFETLVASFSTNNFIIPVGTNVLPIFEEKPRGKETENEYKDK